MPLVGIVCPLRPGGLNATAASCACPPRPLPRPVRYRTGSGLEPRVHEREPLRHKCLQGGDAVQVVLVRVERVRSVRYGIGNLRGLGVKVVRHQDHVIGIAGQFAMKDGLPPLMPGYQVRILDGNHLAATERRLKVLNRS